MCGGGGEATWDLSPVVALFALRLEKSINNEGVKELCKRNETDPLINPVSVKPKIANGDYIREEGAMRHPPSQF